MESDICGTRNECQTRHDYDYLITTVHDLRVSVIVRVIVEDLE
jgi:hypothetical protein